MTTARRVRTGAASALLTLALGAATVGPAVAAPGAATPIAAAPAAVATHWSRPAPYPVSSTSRAYARLLRHLSGPTLERTFLAGMIEHHAMAVHMSQMELDQGRRRTEQALARKIIRDQQREIATMTSWLRRWYGMTPEQAMAAAPRQARMLQMAMDRQMRADMMTLEDAAAGTATDREFLRLMIPHHQAAVLEARAALHGTTHARLATLERSIVRSQRAEIRTMSVWLRTWFRAGA